MNMDFLLIRDLEMSRKLSPRIVKSVIFELSFTVFFSSKQQIQMVSNHNQYIHLRCSSISPTKDKITVMICSHKDKKKTSERETKWRPKMKQAMAAGFFSPQCAHIFSLNEADLFLLSHTNHTFTARVRNNIYIGLG